MVDPSIRRHHNVPPLLSLALAVLLALLAIFARLVLGPTLTGYPFLTFFPAILLSTLVGGRRAGTICAILSTLLAWYYLIEPTRSFLLLWPSGPVALLIFMAIAATIVGVIDGMKRSEARARASEHALERLNHDLEDRVAARTIELNRTNKELTFEMESRAAAEEQV